jgi:hypothetical protein
MPTATLTFRLPEESNEHRLALDGAYWWGVAWDIDQWLRNQLKHGCDHQTPEAALQAARDQLHEIIQSRNLELDGYG